MRFLLAIGARLARLDSWWAHRKYVTDYRLEMRAWEMTRLPEPATPTAARSNDLVDDPND